MRFRAIADKVNLSIGVDKENRIIKGFAVATKGEAKGHDLYLDSEFLNQIVKIGNASNSGIKSRFTHPGLCSDGMGKQLGRVKNFRVDGDIVRADLHLLSQEILAKSPDGDLGEFIMGLATEDPEAFGASIVFERDEKAEKDLLKTNTVKGKFASPDKLNQRNLAHARLYNMSAADIVDEPAANTGFFSDTEELATKAEQVLKYVFDISTEVPSVALFNGMEPEKVKTFVKTFLARNNLQVKGIELMSTENKPDDMERFKALKAKFADRPAFIVEQFEKGNDVLKAEIELKDVMIKELTEKLAAMPKIVTPTNSGPDPVAHMPSDKGTKFFSQYVTEYMNANKCDKGFAINALIPVYPEEYERFKSTGK